MKSLFHTMLLVSWLLYLFISSENHKHVEYFEMVDTKSQQKPFLLISNNYF